MGSPIIGKQDRMEIALNRTNIRWRTIPTTLLVLWIVGMIDKIGVAVITTNPAFLAEMNLIGQNALIGSLVSIMLFSYSIGFFFWGYFTDRYGPKLCSTMGVIFWGVSTALAAISPNFTVLMISRLLLGLSEAYLWPVSNSLTARWFPLKERGRAKSIWINGVSVGAGISGFIVLGLIDDIGWRGVFWFFTALSFVICLPMILFLVKDDPQKDKRVSEEELKIIQNGQLIQSYETIKGQKSVFSSFHYWLIVIAYTGTVLGVYGLGTWFPDYLKKTGNFNPVMISVLMLLAWTAAIILTFWVGARTDKTNRKAIWNSIGFLGSAIVLIMALLGFSSVLNAIFVGIAVALIQGFTTPMGQGLIDSISKTENIGKYTGVMTGVSNLISAFGPTIMGALITLGKGNYIYSFYFLIIVFLISAACSIILKRRGY